MAKGYHLKDVSRLTPREHQVLQTLVQYPEKSQRECAEYLGCTHKTFKTHLHNIYDTLGVSDCRGAVIKGLQLKLIELENPTND